MTESVAVAGFVAAGEVSGNTTFRNGNNGIDTISSKPEFHIHHNSSQYNGADGVFVGGDALGQIAEVDHCDVRNNYRMGLLFNGTTLSAYHAKASYIDATNNYMRSVSFSKCYIPQLTNSYVGAATVDVAVFVEGANNYTSPMEVCINNNTFEPPLGSAGDIAGTIGGYTGIGSTLGRIKIQNNDYFGRVPSIAISNYSPLFGMNIPPSYLSVTAPLVKTAVAGGTIALQVLSLNALNTAALFIAPVAVSLRFTTDANGSSASSVTTCSVTAGQDLNTTVISSYAFTTYGEVDWNIALSTPGTRYAVITMGSETQIVQLTWT